MQTRRTRECNVIPPAYVVPNINVFLFLRVIYLPAAEETGHALCAPHVNIARTLRREQYAPVRHDVNARKRYAPRVVSVCSFSFTRCGNRLANTRVKHNVPWTLSTTPSYDVKRVLLFTR